jgi:Flp pilus assembly protein TadD
MQNFIETIRSVVGQSGLFILVMGIVIGLLYVWELISSKEGFIRWRLRWSPKNADLHIVLGDLLESVDEFEEAEREYRTAIELNPRSRQGYYQLYSLQNKTKKTKDADETIAHLTDIFPEDALVYIWKGFSLQDQDNKKAEEYFQKSISLAPQSSFNFTHFGQFLIRQKRFEEAEVILRDALRRHPVYAYARLNLAYVLEELGQPVEAEKEYRKYVRFNSREINGYYYYSKFLYQQKRLVEAENVIRKGIGKKPNDANAHSILGTILHGKFERLDEAEAEYRKAIQLDPSDAISFYNFGNLLGNLRRYEEAEAAYRKAIEINPLDTAVYNNLGNALKDMKRYDEAEHSIRKAIELDSSNVDAYNNLGVLLSVDGKNRFVEAEIAYRKSLELNPSAPNASHNLAKLLRTNSKENDAILVLQKALEANSKDFIALMGIASIKRTLGKINETKEYADKSRLFVPDDENYWYNLACLEAILGNYEIAFENLTKATQEKDFDKEWAWQDPDLAWIRDDPRFAEIVGPKSEK